MRQSRSQAVLVASAMVALLAIAGYGAWQGEAPRAIQPKAAILDPDEPQPRTLTAEEESYEAALWPIHREIIEGSAGSMTVAGIVYVTEGRDVTKLVAAVQPLVRRFHDASRRAQAILPPPGLQAVHDEYLAALSLYERAATEMLKVEADRRDEHLVAAQRMTEEAAEDIVKAGDILWPAEHKPN